VAKLPTLFAVFVVFRRFLFFTTPPSGLHDGTDIGVLYILIIIVVIKYNEHMYEDDQK